MNRWKTKSLKKKKKMALMFKAAFFIVVFFTVFSFVAAGGTFIWLKRNMPSPEKLLEREVPLSTKIYDRTGKTVLYEIFSKERRTIIKLEDIPPYLIDATIIAEDKNFFAHPGFNFKSMIRAIIVDILKGGKVQGGSTITQQFIKNAFLTPKKTILRKIKELFLAYQIEKKFSKKEILQMYFNEIPYGGTAYGIEAASHLYFQKSAKDLSLDEAALLAALPKAPTYYSPWGPHKQELLNRRNYILNSMTEEGYITERMAEEAKKINTLAKIKPFKESILAPHFVMYVKELLVEKYGHRLVEQGGLKVITTLDLKAQQTAEKTISQSIKTLGKWGANNAALCAIDVKKGEILAMVGSADFWNTKIDGQVNIATSLRQPGSSFKPIVYAAAFEKGYTPETLLFDVKTDFGPAGPEKKHYIPLNYDLKERGPVTIRQALAGSLNIPSVKVAYLAGIKNIVQLAKRMGYTSINDPQKYGLSLALGAAEVKLLEHTAAFSVFARDGLRIPITPILEVKDSQGRILEKKEENDFENFRAISPQTARAISDILSDQKAREAIFGSNPNFLLPDRPAAVKTGTTNEFRDAWTIGYTAGITTGVWVGNADNTPMKKGADGAKMAAPIWHKFMIQITKKYPPRKFIPPEPYKGEKLALKGEVPEEITLKIDKISGKLATEFTPKDLVEEKTFKGYHSILYWVDKDNPQGPLPDNPSSDKQFQYWEEAIQAWLKTQKEEEFALAPTEYDDVHIPSNFPEVKILSPRKFQNIDKKILKISVEASAPQGISSIACFIDGTKIDSIPVKEQVPSFQCFANLSGLEKGRHILSVLAEDDAGNQGKDEITINLLNNWPKQISISWPKDKKTIKQSEFPLNVNFLIPLDKFKVLRLYIQNTSLTEQSLLSTLFSPPPQTRQILLWPKSKKGEYFLWVEGETSSGEIVKSDKIKITVY